MNSSPNERKYYSKLTTLTGCSIALTGALIVSYFSNQFIEKVYRATQRNYQPLNNIRISNTHTNNWR
jgi:hypothetical protein